MNIHDLLIWGLRLTGVGQLFIAGMTFWLRRVIGWQADLEKLRPFNRCVVHTYGYYIQAINAVFGLICLLQPGELLAKTPLAADVTLLMAVYWLGRLTLGFVYYDTREFTTQRRLYFWGNWAFNVLFAAQITALAGALAYNLAGLMGGTLAEISDLGALFLAALIVFSGGMAIKGHKLARRIFGAGLAVLTLEGFTLLLDGLNDQYFHSRYLEQCVKTYFAWTGGYVGFIAGIVLILAGLAIGLIGRSAGESG